MLGVSTHRAMPCGSRQPIRPWAWAIAEPHTAQGIRNMAAIAMARWRLPAVLATTASPIVVVAAAVLDVPCSTRSGLVCGVLRIVGFPFESG